MPRLFSILVCSMITLNAHAILAKEAGSIAVSGAVMNPASWSPQQVRQQFADKTETLKFSTHEGKEQHVGTGIPLLTLLQVAALKTEKTPKHYDLSFVIIVEARDSYRAVFSYSELLPKLGHADAYLVWEMDGKPLPDKEGPFRLVVTSDKDPDRHIYGISNITVVDGIKLANKLSACQ